MRLQGYSTKQIAEELRWNVCVVRIRHCLLRRQMRAVGMMVWV